MQKITEEHIQKSLDIVHANEKAYLMNSLHTNYILRVTSRPAH